MTLVAAERLDLVAATARDEEAREHLGGQQPIHAREVDERTACRLGDVVAGGVAAEEDDLLNALGHLGREAGGGEAGTRACEERRWPVGARVQHGCELRGLVLRGGRALEHAVGEPDPEPVVPDDPVRTGETLEEAARRRVVPVLLEVRHPAPAEEQQRPFADARVREPAPVELREAEVLLHHP